MMWKPHWSWDTLGPSPASVIHCCIILVESLPQPLWPLLILQGMAYMSPAQGDPPPSKLALSVLHIIAPSISL